MIVPGNVSHWKLWECNRKSCLPVSLRRLTRPSRDRFFYTCFKCWYSTLKGVMFCWLTKICSFFTPFFTAVVTCTELNSQGRAESIKSFKSWGCFEFALQRTFWSTEREGRVVSKLHSHFSCFTLAVTSLWGQKCGVVWPRRCIAQPQNSGRLRFHWWNIAKGWVEQYVIKKRLSSITKKDGVNY